MIKLQWSMKWNWCIFILENASENVVCEMAAILSRVNELTQISQYQDSSDISEDNVKGVFLEPCYDQNQPWMNIDKTPQNIIQQKFSQKFQALFWCKDDLFKYKIRHSNNKNIERHTARCCMT